MCVSIMVRKGSMEMPHYSDMIKQLRKREGLTQEELASKLGITRSRLNNFEQGIREPDFQMVELFCDYFNVDPNVILGYDPVNPNYIPEGSFSELSDAGKVLFQSLKGATEEEILQAVKIIEALKKQ